MDENYKTIVRHYESCLDRFGDSHLGVDWPRLDDAQKRYRIMCEVEKFSPLKKKTYSMLDFGCGAGHLLQYLQQNSIEYLTYEGCDLSLKFVELCKAKFPNTPFLQIDAIANPESLEPYDLIIMNGVFTEKRSLTFDQMWEYCQKLIEILYSKCKVGIAFNVMSKHVQWEREDLFHLPHDLLADFLIKKVSRNFVMRNDYGLYEYTTYVYR